MRIIAGKFKGRSLASPLNDAIRPTSDRNRESLFNILKFGMGVVFDENRVLDLFAGTGALGFEALSRGAAQAVFVEKSPAARALIQQNIENFSLQSQTRILRRDATDIGKIARLRPFNLIFADPPYGQGLGEKALVSALEGGWLSDNAIVILEEVTTATIILPPCFICRDERRYGNSILRFYEMKLTLFKGGAPAAN